MIQLFLTFFFLASGISSNKVLLYALSPEFLVGIRMAVAALLLGIYTVWQLQHRIDWNRVWKQLPWLVTIAFFTSFFPPNLKSYALAHMPSSKMAFFGTLDPFIAALYSYFLFKERLTVRQWIGMSIGFLGMLILLRTTVPLEEQLRAFSVISYPEIAAFLSIVLSRFGWILAQQMLRKEQFGPLQFNILTMAIGGAISLIAAYLIGSTTITSLADAPLSLLKNPPLGLVSSSTQLLIFLSYTIVIGNMIGLTMYASALKRFSATLIALTGFTIPLLVAFFGWLFLNEPLSVTFFVSCIVTFLGLIIFFYDEKTLFR